MKRRIVFVIILLLISAIGIIYWQFWSKQQQKTVALLNSITSMKLSSPAFADNQDIPVLYTCDGESINPPLLIEDVPQNSQSLVLIVDDPDSPGRNFSHWVVWNIDPFTKEVAGGTVPAGALQGLNSVKKIGYYPPCPSSGKHHYNFQIYALDTKIDLPEPQTKESILEKIKGHVIDQAQLVGLYSRSRLK